MRISTVGYTMKQGVKNIGRNKLFSFASIATISACIFLFGIFFSIVINFNYIVKLAEEGVAITVFFEKDATDEEVSAIGMALRDRDDVADVKFVSAEDAWTEFQDRYFDGSKEAAEGFKDDNPLIDSDNYEVYMKDVATQKELVKFTEGLPGVRKVNKSDIVANTLSSINKLVAYVSIAIIAILLLVSVFLINNTITMGITVRREEIAIMKYIGAKDSFVRAPFVLEGLIIGISGAVIPLVGLFFAYENAVVYVFTKFPILNRILDFLPVTEVYKTLLPVGLALGAGIGLLGSSFTIRKHLRV